MKSQHGLSQRRRIFSRLVVLALLILTLTPAAPAAAQEPAPPTFDGWHLALPALPAQGPVTNAPQGDVSATALSLGMKKIVPTDGQDGGFFGGAIAISGDMMVVGSYQATVDEEEYQGAAYLYGRNVGGPGAWGLIKKLIADDGVAEDYFGSSVAIYGTTVVIGAYDHYNGRPGAAYIFERDAGGLGMWGQAKKLSAPDGAIEDCFGASVAVSGGTIVVSAIHATIDGKEDQGAAYVFGRNVGGSGNWGMVAKLTADDGVAEDMFGASAAIDGATIAVGTIYADVRGYGHAGAVYLFSRDAGGVNQWGQIKKLVAELPYWSGYFGISVGISGDTVVVGASESVAHGGKVVDGGSAYIFERDAGGAGQWGQVKRLAAPDGLGGFFFGWSVAISGNTIVVGAIYASITQQYQGAVYVFGRDSTGVNEWGPIAKVYDPAGADYAWLGVDVAIDGTTFVAGASRDYGLPDVVSGAAYVFTPYSLRVNSAGPRYVDTAGNLWVADRSWLPGVPITPGTTPWGYVGGIGRVVSAGIAGTEDDKLYQSERLWTGAARPGYRFVVPNGRYRIAFKYAETYWNAAGKRRFTIMAENKICVSNYDPFIAAGGAKNKAAPDVVFYVAVTDGELDIHFISAVGQAKADAIYIQQLLQ